TLVSGLVVSRSAHRKYARLWISLDRLEEMTLIHEFGHLLGLVGNPTHEQSNPAHRHHCTSLRCSMAHPRLRVILRSFPAGIFNQFITDHCADCQADIRTAQAYWRDRVRAEPDYVAHRERERAMRAAAVSVGGLWTAGKYDIMLSRLQELRAAWPEY